MKGPDHISGRAKGIGGHHSPVSIETTWLTPPYILEALGGWASFDLDPCASPPPQPWRTAQEMIAAPESDGLAARWHGRVWLNPPYGREMGAWLWRLAGHNCGTALIFARTETEIFRRTVWERASGLLFLYGRLNFHDRDGIRADKNSGAPSVLCAYGASDLDRLAAANLEGALIPLRFPRTIAVLGLAGTWPQEVRDWIGAQRGPVSVSDAYRFFARHPKARRNPNWQAKVRQTLALVATRIERGRYQA